MQQLFIYVGSVTGAWFILLFLDEKTLFLAALLLAVLSINKSLSSRYYPVFGLWFALSVAPAASIEPQNLLLLSNGFILQTLLSLLFFLGFNHYKPSLIGRLAKGEKTAAHVTAYILSGFASGIVSATLWQVSSTLL